MLESLSVASAPNHGGRRRPKPHSSVNLRTERISGRQRKPLCTTPGRKVRMALKLNWRNAVSRTHCTWRLQAESTEGPNMPTTQETPAKSPIGRDTPRVDGPLKVTGKAQYASDYHFPGLLY